MRANETDINNLKLVLDGYDQPVRISLNIEYGAVVAKNARRTDSVLMSCGLLQLALLASVYHALKGLSASGCSSQKNFSVFTEITLTI
jgi:hypothetical protein